MRQNAPTDMSLSKIPQTPLRGSKIPYWTHPQPGAHHNPRQTQVVYRLQRRLQLVTLPQMIETLNRC